MTFYNTLTRQQDEFTPLSGKNVSLYTCGLTVYSHPHIGNWVSYIYWDVLVRLLRAQGFNVTRVQNITDVGHLTSDEDAGEDKMLRSALREGKTAWEVAEKYIQIADDEAYNQLGLIRPNHMPRATEYIPQQIAFVQELEAKGYTYTIADGVYFDTSKLDDYGKLARLDISGLQFGARVADTGKKNPTDFALWKFSPEDEKRDMEWWAPWENPEHTLNEVHVVGEPRAMDVDAVQEGGEQRTEPYKKYGEGSSAADAAAMRHEATSAASSAGWQGEPTHGSWGFPGWHLECSVMARELLGDQIDIHTGGIDHIPVHHTNEIAQTEAVTDKKFSNFWLHANHIKVDGTKMSKSLGNIYTLQDILDKGYDLQAFKLLVLSKHYRTEGNFTWEILDAAQNRLNNWRTVADLVHQGTTEYLITKEAFEDMVRPLKEALQNDLDTPQAIAYIDKQFAIAEQAANKPDRNFLLLGALIKSINDLLGIDIASEPLTEDQEALITAREQARTDQNWAKSDELRDQLKEQGIEVRDTPNGTIWSRS